MHIKVSETLAYKVDWVVVQKGNDKVNLKLTLFLEEQKFVN